MMFTIDDLLARHTLSAPDGRLLHAYAVTDAEFALMTERLSQKRSEGRPLSARIFVLWAAEEVRRNHRAGMLSWDFLLGRFGLAGQRTQAVELAVEGLAFWGRPIRRRRSDDKSLYLYSLMAEGGLPDAFLSRGSGYAAAVLGAIGDIEREALLAGDSLALERVAARRVSELPAAFQTAESTALLRDLAMAFVELRRDLPAIIGIDAAEIWLTRNRPDWSEQLPLRLSEEARWAILIPALARQMDRPGGGALAVRLLVSTDAGHAWMGALRISRGAVLPFGLLAQADRTLVLRLVASNGRSLRASPQTGGWQFEMAEDVLIALEPWEPAVLSAYADGRLLGDVVIDPGLPDLSETPILWRAERPGMGDPQALIPAVSGRSRGDRLWLLSPETPLQDQNLTLHDPQPGPGGSVWPISGRGRVMAGGVGFAISTNADEDEPAARLLVLADSCREGQVDGGLPAYVGTPRFLGGRGDLPLRDVTQHVRRTASRGLATHRFDWIDEGQIVASTRAVFLSPDLHVTVREETGGLSAEVSGLPLDWRMALHLGDTRNLMPATVSRFKVGPADADQGEVLIEFFDADGHVLHLRRPWPAQAPMLIDPQGRRLSAPRQVSLRSLLGWRGVLPRDGALQLRMPKSSHSVAFGETGMVRLAAWRPLLAQAQALSGADGRVSLQLVNDRQSPPLEVSRHDWTPERIGTLYELGSGPVDLTASTVHAPVMTRHSTASRLFDPASWLGDVPHVWFVQGKSAAGVMRPFPWSSFAMTHSTREQRIDAYLGAMAQMMADPLHPGWSHLTDVLDAARAGGDCGSLDQAQALGAAPDVAVALIFRADPAGAATLLDLETEAPVWWPAVPVSAWARGIGAGLALIVAALSAAGFNPAEALDAGARQLARVCGTILSQRPELSGHLGRAMVANGLAPIAISSGGGPLPLAAPRNPERLKQAAQQLAARSPDLPQGAASLDLCHLKLPTGFSPHLTPVLKAPLVVAEVAMGLRHRLSPALTLDLLALRHVDPVWFDTALPIGLSLA